MTDAKKFDLLCQDGDPIERQICADHEFLAPVIYIYAKVWADFVRPHRIGDGSSVTAEWMPFAGSHYTAIVRLYHAYRFKRHLWDVSAKLKEGAREADILLKAHAATAGFWENLGSCIDNLSLAFEDGGLIIPLGTDEDEAIEGSGGRKHLKMKYPRLGEAYDRRTQFIHSRLIPQKVVDGALVFNVRHLQSKDTGWPSKHGVQTEFVEDFHENFWKDFVAQLGDAWEYLYHRLRGKHGGPAPTASVPPFKPGRSPIEPPLIDMSGNTSPSG